MSEPTSSIRINLSAGEIEIQGTEEFVERHLSRVDEIVQSVASLEKHLGEGQVARPDKTPLNDSSIAPTAQVGVPDYFGEWMYQFPKDDLTEADKALVAAYFAQQHSDDDDFATGDVTDTLGEVGIELSNASRSLGRLSDERKLYKTRREGRYQRYKVSEEGVEHLKSLREEG